MRAAKRHPEPAAEAEQDDQQLQRLLPEVVLVPGDLGEEHAAEPCSDAAGGPDGGRRLVHPDPIAQPGDEPGRVGQEAYREVVQRRRDHTEDERPGHPMPQERAPA
jgi:hypothetical protein